MYTDWRFLRIPNAFTYPAMAVGLVFGVLEGVPGGLFTRGLVDHIAALILAFAISYPFYAARGLKAGDAKLLMAIGALRGVNFLLFAAVYGALIGGVLAVGFILRRRLARPVAGAAPNTLAGIMKTSIPYGVALGLGGLVALALEAAGYVQVTV
jgi:prepilin peptidase CpaA